MDALQEPELRRVDGDLDVKLSNYAKLSAGGAFVSDDFIVLPGPADGASQLLNPAVPESMEMEIHSLLEKLLDINDSMSRCAASAARLRLLLQLLKTFQGIETYCMS
ncbi:golgi snare 12 [Perilla frutescens var. hirtella]|uniref:Golgi snare 12 n=1 Tax=Perilla frutescens var. hirtella TaxID=608512 RepID=A0AAD4IWS2_PERFH|nr:golgi snare 12 [Perilla frutescens var. hirtella]KAH6817799.1 golgi snare 12 [Perilla frutescens var. frutescens]KAH6822980.1 golgi snare 12 [Perilla frutescens var. hirtella]